MPDKLTDEQIKKALECCTQGRDIKVCWNCPLYVDLETAKECCQKLNTNALDLINRLQAEKQDIEIELKAMRNAANGFKAENERLEELFEHSQANYWNISNLIHKYRNKAIIAKAEAYKEFAERLKNLVRFSTPLDRIVIDNLLKELVGEDNTSLDNKNLIK